MVITRLRHLLIPEIKNCLVRNVFQLLFCKGIIIKYLWNVNEARSIRIAHDCQCCIAEPVFISWTNNSSVAWVIKTIQHCNGFLNKKVTLVWRVKFKQIQPNWVCHFARIEINYILYSFFWHHSKKRFSRIPMGINKGKALPIKHVLQCKIFKQL